MIGTKLGHYEITSHLGSGGMGEVYQATDTRLGRAVAIKTLPAAFTTDPERVTRLQREARVLASLSHPNIAAIYGLEEWDSKQFLVMELARGETLAAMIARGPIAIDRALQIAKQIAAALEAAHDQGVTHRDLKPANIIVGPEDTVKILDFGLAKALAVDGDTNLSNSPTLVTISAPGVLLGTAAYMAPEQAKGRPVDRATDLWAFGCVFYEMLTGRPVFAGETVPEILGEIFKVEPDWNRLPSQTPHGIARLLRRCLQKDPKLRLRDARDAFIEIEEARSGDRSRVDMPAKAVRGRERVIAWVLVFIALIAAAEGVWLLRPAAKTLPPPEMRLDIATPPTTDPLSFALSPDGQKIVFVASSEGRARLWLRNLDSDTARPLMGTEEASYPIWSPDSRSVAFFANTSIKRVDLDGGTVQTIGNAAVPAGGAWNRDGVVIFPIVPDSPLFKGSDKGAEAVPITQVLPQQTGHRFPQFLSDGRHFLYYVAGAPQVRGIYVSDLGGTQQKRLRDSDTPAVFEPPETLLFVHQGTLFAQRFNSTSLELQGDAYPIAEHVSNTGPAGVGAISASRTGSIAYRTGSAGSRQLMWFDRSGKELHRVGPPVSTPMYMSASPDQRRVAIQRQTNGNTDIWILDLERDGADRFTTDPQPDISPLWSPDGDSIVFASAGKSTLDLFQKRVSGGAAQLLLTTPDAKQATDWSRDGRYMLFRTVGNDMDIWALPLVGDKKPFPVVKTPFIERDAQFSPDGKWIAYQANDSGRFEIYVQPFPVPGKRTLVSIGGGTQVRWRHDGKELFYLALDGKLMAVPIELGGADKAKPGQAVPLFFARVGSVQDISLPHYIVSHDGKRFLIDTLVEEAAPPITILLNWKAK